MASLTDAASGAQWGGQFGTYGAIAGALDGYFGGPIFKAFKDAHTAPDFAGLEKLTLDAATTGLDQFFTQLPYTERLDKALGIINNTDNEAWQKMLTKIDPSAVDNAGVLGTQINSFLHGEIPTDVQNQIRRNSAFKSLQGGFAGSPMATNLTARDFGLNSLDLIGKGIAALPTEASYDKFLNPSQLSVASSFLSPTDLLQRNDREDSYNNQIENQNRLINYEIALANKTGNLGMLSGGFGLLGKGGGTTAPAAGGGGGMDISSIMKMFGGGGGGGSGGGMFGGGATDISAI